MSRLNDIEKTSRHKSLEERAKRYGGKLGPYTEFKWNESDESAIIKDHFREKQDTDRRQ